MSAGLFEDTVGKGVNQHPPGAVGGVFALCPQRDLRRSPILILNTEFYHCLEAEILHPPRR